MAKVGEGDARWLVSDRADGRNVGNWHWSEKSLFPWAKEQMEATFAEYVVHEDDRVKIWFAGVDSFKGEITINNRKGKVLFIWDVNMHLRWKGVLKGAEEALHEAGGRMECTDINVTDEEFDTKFTIDTGDDARGRELLALLKSKAVSLVKKEWKQMTTLMAQVHADSSKQGATSSSTPAPSTPKPVSVTPTPAAAEPAPQTVTKSITTSGGQKLSVRTISQVVKFQTASSAMFETLVDAGRVSAFTGSAAQISTQKGSTFNMFGGTVQGIVEDTIPGKLIAQKWRFAFWPEDHYSQVTIELEDKGGSKCLVKLTQAGVPEADYDRTRLGWEEHFWRRIKAVFGWSYKVKE